MSRGQPDYGNPDYAISQVSFDPSTLLTAIKGVNSVDGKGRVWKIDNFENGFSGWETDSGGDGAIPILSSAFPQVGSVSVYMDAGSLALSGESIIRQRFFMGVPARLGLEAGLYFDVNSPDYIITIDYLKTGSSFQAGLKLSALDRTISVQTSSGWVTVATLEASVFTSTWFALKLVVDFSVSDYVRLVYGGNSVDIDQYQPLTSATTGIGIVTTYITSLASSGGNIVGVVGYAIITLDEP